MLEIGCGQGERPDEHRFLQLLIDKHETAGDMTAVLAVVVGSEGHVTAIDPASADYG